MMNEFTAANQQFSSATTSWGEQIFYEESSTASGHDERVLVNEEWVYCCSSELMHPQANVDGFQRGSRATYDGHDCTVLSVYRMGTFTRACVMLDHRAHAHDRQGMPLSCLTLVHT